MSCFSYLDPLNAWLNVERVYLPADGASLPISHSVRGIIMSRTHAAFCVGLSGFSPGAISAAASPQHLDGMSQTCRPALQTDTRSPLSSQMTQPVKGWVELEEGDASDSQETHWCHLQQSNPRALTLRHSMISCSFLHSDLNTIILLINIKAMWRKQTIYDLCLHRLLFLMVRLMLLMLIITMVMA